MPKIASVDLSQYDFSIALLRLRRVTCTAASVHLVVIFIPFIVYYAYVAI
jgi:hypothetical protein